MLRVRRIPKALAHELILYAKKVDVKFNLKDPRSTAAFEFHRQISSQKIKKAHPSFECNMVLHEGTEAPVINAEFINGEKWNLDASAMHAAALREEFFTKIEQIEDWYEVNEGGRPGTADDISSKSKGAASKGGKK